MKRLYPLLCLATLCCTLLPVAAQTPPPATAEQPTVKAKTPQTPSWGMTVESIPHLLRVHLSQLTWNAGLLVTEVEPNSLADDLGLRPDDVLLYRNGRPVRNLHSLASPSTGETLRILRRGQIRTLGGRNGFSVPPQYVRPWQPSGFPQPRIGFPVPPQMPVARPGASASSYSSGGYASASSSGNGQAVSVSRAGDQISIEMSMPELSGGRVKLEGTAAEIQSQLKVSDLPPNAKRQIQQTIDQMN